MAADYNHISEIARRIKPAVEDGVKQGAELIAAKAKVRAPVETGALKAAIHVELEHNGYSVVAGNDNVFYGHMVEHGTSHSAARPFLVPALEDSRKEIIKLAELQLKQVLGLG